MIDSRLLPLEECQRLHGDFCRSTQAPPDDATALARWLIAEGVLTRYQARVLLAGKAGPFRLADYTILDRHGDGQIKGVYQATSRSSGERAVLLVVPAERGGRPGSFGSHGPQGAKGDRDGRRANEIRAGLAASRIAGFYCSGRAFACGRGPQLSTTAVADAGRAERRAGAGSRLRSGHRTTSRLSSLAASAATGARLWSAGGSAWP